MKNTMKALGVIAIVAVIGFSFAACGDGSDGGGGGGGGGGGSKEFPTKGKLTITGLEAYNGKYVMGVGPAETRIKAYGKILIVTNSAGWTEEVKREPAKISGGKATLKVFKEYNSADGLYSYEESDNSYLSIFVYEKATSSYGSVIGYVDVQFTNGDGGTVLFVANR